MKRGKFWALLLSLSMFCTVLPGTTAMAVEKNGSGETGAEDGIVRHKYVEDNEDGTYKITLEAYATGEQISIPGKKVPTDIILVLDQSGSMAEEMPTYEFKAYPTQTTNGEFYRERFNDGDKNLYYPFDEGYVEVSVDYEDVAVYTKVSGQSHRYYWYYSRQNNLYACIEGEYHKVTVAQDWRDRGAWVYRANGEEIGRFSASSNSPDFSDADIDGGCLYLLSSERKYTYSYTLPNEGGEAEPTIIETSTGENSRPTKTYYGMLEGNEVTRLNALKTAVNNFVGSVSTKAEEDDLDHRIAVVGYAQGAKEYEWRGEYIPAYTNTEVFIGSQQYQYNSGQINYAYQNAFQDMSTERGQQNIYNSIRSLDANGATYIDTGMEMAEKIFDAHPLDEGEERNRVVVVFTDGQPGWKGFDGEPADGAQGSMTTAENAIATANSLKADHVTVYSVGIFEGANASSNGDKNGNSIEKANWFMQNLSSNNGSYKEPSYYLSAADAGTLDSIFAQISDNIESSGSSTSLNSSAVVKDFIAESFVLSTEALSGEIDIATYRYLGTEPDGQMIWASQSSGPMGAKVSVATKDEVNVTGFDFAENYVGTFKEDGHTVNRGYKLVISFDIAPKDGFLGGNAVPTNTDESGIYAKETDDNPVVTFPVPNVDVPIKPITVTAPDKNIYLLQDVSFAELKQGATVKVGDVELDLTEENYGLKDWQHAYVQIQDRFMANDGELTGDMTDLREDTSYTATVTVTPKTPGGKAETRTGSDDGNINVYKPELTFEDSTVYYGGTAPADNTYDEVNLTGTKWKHTDAEETVTVADEATMGHAPNLGVTYIPETGKIVGEKINTKEDIEVDAGVKIGDVDVTDDTSFSHTKCEGETEDPANGKFWLHVKTCDLTIKKEGGANDEPYVFEISKDGASYTEITITGNNEVTISELPVGDYSIQEDGDWSWRYRPTYENNYVTLNASDPSATITCTNKKYNDHWLNDFSTAVKNVYGEAHSN